MSSEDRRRFENLGASEVIEGMPPLDQRHGLDGAFSFVHCGALPVDGRQLLRLSRIWQLAAPRASLLLGSRVLDAVEESRYLSVKTRPASGLEWIPGRLALRWMIESSGFDVLDWLPEGTVGRRPAGPFAYLAARRSDRVPVFLEQAGPSRDASFPTEAVRETIASELPSGLGEAHMLHCELDPVGLLARLRESTTPGGTLLLGSMMLADPTMAEHVRFVPPGSNDDREWRWVPGALALSSIVKAAGFKVDRRFGETPGPPGELDTVSGYLRATPC